MAKKKEKMYLDPHSKCIIIGNKEYILGSSKLTKIDGITHIEKTLLVEVDYKAKMKKVKAIVKELSKVLDKKEVLTELLNDKLSWDEIDRLTKIFAQKKKPKITKQKGCLGIKIGTGKKKDGGCFLQLID